MSAPVRECATRCILLSLLRDHQQTSPTRILVPAKHTGSGALSSLSPQPAPVAASLRTAALKAAFLNINLGAHNSLSPPPAPVAALRPARGAQSSLSPLAADRVKPCPFPTALNAAFLDLSWRRAQQPVSPSGSRNNQRPVSGCRTQKSILVSSKYTCSGAQGSLSPLPSLEAASRLAAVLKAGLLNTIGCTRSTWGSWPRYGQAVHRAVHLQATVQNFKTIDVHILEVQKLQ